MQCFPLKKLLVFNVQISAGGQQEECNLEGEYANIRHYWYEPNTLYKKEGTVMVRETP